MLSVAKNSKSKRWKQTTSHPGPREARPTRITARCFVKIVTGRNPHDNQTTPVPKSNRGAALLNEYGIAYCKSELHCSDSKEIEYNDLRKHITEFICQTSKFYKACDYLGNIEVSVELKEIFDTKLKDDHHFSGYGSVCIDSDVFAAEQCTPFDLYDSEKCEKIYENLICQLLLAYNVPTDTPHFREKVGHSLSPVFR